MTPGPRRLPLRKILGFILAAILLLAIAGWLWLRSVESRRWGRMTQRVAELRRENDARCGPRPVLRGVPIPGDAWEDYLKAMEMTKSLPKNLQLWKFAERAPDGDRSRAESALATVGPAVELMQRGTRRAESRRVRFDEGEPVWDLTLETRLGQAVSLSTLAVCRARLLEEEGKTLEAAELLLDLSQFGSDLWHNGTIMTEYIGLVLFHHSLIGLKEQICSGKVSPAHLPKIDRELEQLDAAFPWHGPALWGELETFGEMLLTDRFFKHYVGSGVSLPPETRPGWRYCFSTRLQMSAGFDRVEVVIARWHDADRESYVEEQRRSTEASSEMSREENIFASIAFGSMVGGSRIRRDRLTQLRLIRMAVRYYATGKIVDLNDPFGTTLHHQILEKTVKFWGNGKNGMDDGGKGGWSNTVLEDILLEVPVRIP